jgi:hypothetical protein
MFGIILIVLGIVMIIIKGISVPVQKNVVDVRSHQNRQNRKQVDRMANLCRRRTGVCTVLVVFG